MVNWNLWWEMKKTNTCENNWKFYECVIFHSWCLEWNFFPNFLLWNLWLFCWCGIFYMRVINKMIDSVFWNPWLFRWCGIFQTGYLWGFEGVIDSLFWNPRQLMRYVKYFTRVTLTNEICFSLRVNKLIHNNNAKVCLLLSIYYKMCWKSWAS